MRTHDSSSAATGLYDGTVVQSLGLVVLAAIGRRDDHVPRDVIEQYAVAACPWRRRAQTAADRPIVADAFLHQSGLGARERGRCPRRAVRGQHRRGRRVPRWSPCYLAPNTLAETRRILDTALLPRLAGVPLAKVRPEQLDGVLRRAAPRGA